MRTRQTLVGFTNYPRSCTTYLAKLPGAIGCCFDYPMAEACAVDVSCFLLVKAADVFLSTVAPVVA